MDTIFLILRKVLDAILVQNAGDKLFDAVLLHLLHLLPVPDLLVSQLASSELLQDADLLAVLLILIFQLLRPDHLQTKTVADNRLPSNIDVDISW